MNSGQEPKPIDSQGRRPLGPGSPFGRARLSPPWASPPHQPPFHGVCLCERPGSFPGRSLISTISFKQGGRIPALGGAPSPKPGETHLRTVPFCAWRAQKVKTCTQATSSRTPGPPQAFRAAPPSGLWSLRPHTLTVGWHRGTEAEVLVYWLTRPQKKNPAATPAQ